MSLSPTLDRILILDFGSQYTQLIARRIRELHVYSELVPADISESFIRNFAPKGVILSGGPETVTNQFTLRAPKVIFELNCPILGICYGMQTMALQLGGKVETTNRSEFGKVKLQLQRFDSLFEGILSKDSFNRGEPVTFDVWMSHADAVTVLPPGFERLASSPNAPDAVIADLRHQWYGVQFHPEVTHTAFGARLLENFVKNSCHCRPTWVSTRILEDQIKAIKTKVGEESVVVGVSGGVDSAVTATLLHRALGDQLTCIFVNTGLLRLHEREEVLSILAHHLKIKLTVVDAEETFLNALKGICDPEEKRKIVGRLFIEVFESQAKLLNAKWLGQGTIYPDVIESAKTLGSKSHVIKTHHNVGGLPSHMQLKLLEPLRELFKDEVRQLGLLLDLPKEWVYRHPFPGPGLAIRILGEVKPDYLHILKQADAIFLEELRKHDLYHKINQAFAVFIPMQSVGVKGDARHQGYIIALRAVETIDFMTARWAELPHDFLSLVSHRIINEIKEISRVVYDITNKPPATIEWE